MVLVALAACVCAEDQETAEQYFRTYGYWPSWYSGVHTGLYRSAYPMTYSYPLAYNYAPYSYYPGYYATPVVAEKKAEEKSSRVARSADETHDQESAEQYFIKYGVYPSWYTGAYYGTPASTFKVSLRGKCLVKFVF